MMLGICWWTDGQRVGGRGNSASTSEAGGVMPSASGGPAVFLGVRHHSPACARLVARAIATLRPAYVLVEGPADMNGRLDELLLGHRLPVAVFSHYRDESRVATSWAPLCDYSRSGSRCGRGGPRERRCGSSICRPGIRRSPNAPRAPPTAMPMPRRDTRRRPGGCARTSRWTRWTRCGTACSRSRTTGTTPTPSRPAWTPTSTWSAATPSRTSATGHARSTWRPGCGRPWLTRTGGRFWW